jgi:hypothetical protein
MRVGHRRNKMIRIARRVYGISSFLRQPSHNRAQLTGQIGPQYRLLAPEIPFGLMFQKMTGAATTKTWKRCEQEAYLRFTHGAKQDRHPPAIGQSPDRCSRKIIAAFP